MVTLRGLSGIVSQPAVTRPGYSLPLVDAATWLVGVALAVWSRYDFALTPEQLTSAGVTAGLAAAVHLLTAHLLHLYRGRHRTGSFDEVRAVSVTASAGALAALAANQTLPAQLVPASSPIIGGVLALVLMLGVRYLHRLRNEHARRPDTRTATPVLLFGAGAAGHDLLRAMLRDPDSRYVPVGLLDDDPAKRHLRVHGVRVLGGQEQIADAVARTGAAAVVLSLSDADASLIRTVRQRTLAAGATFKTLPSVGELLDNRVEVADVRDVRVGDLLGRRHAAADLTSPAGLFRGKRVLVTGAGGSIGSELCRQLHRLDPSELIMLDHDESALHAVELSIRGQALLDTSEVVLADLRDTAAVRAVFESRRPDIVFHAAALKHLPLLERYPAEAVKSNIWGTLTVLEQARDVEAFVNISTDKAANPSSVLGYSKRITERLTAHAATRHDGVFVSVRFGNVLGSSGSVLTAFTAQLAAGGPITVTHPEVTRYFMTIHEAVQLVIRAATIGRDGEALILDMGDPVRIVELARQLAEQAATPAKIVYTGLRPGEKLREELFGDGERDLRPIHPLISHTDVPPIDPVEVRRLTPYADAEVLTKELARLCGADATGPTGRRATA